MHPTHSRSFFGLLLTLLAVSACADAQVRGRLVDYRTDAPIANATVTLSQRGWGRSGGQLVWDKEYRATTRTGPDGSFELSFPGPRVLTGRGGTLSVEAPGWQRLTEIVVPDRATVYLQTLPMPDVTVPGGTAQLGVLEDGRYFGWSFVDDGPVLDPEQADIFPVMISRDHFGLALYVPRGGGMHFVSQEEQRVVRASYGHLLRYVSEAPPDGYASALTLDGRTPGTIFVRTPHGRYAKLAFDPERLMTGSGQLPGFDGPVRYSIMLPYAYNPRPGRDLPFDPTGAPVRVDPSVSSVLADLPDEGEMPRVARTYRLTMHDDGGALVDSLVVRLEPGVARDLEGAPRAGSERFSYRGVRLDYGDDGLPRVRLSVRGEHFAHNSAPMAVGRRRPTVMEVHVFAPNVPARRFELRLQEVGEQ